MKSSDSQLPPPLRHGGGTSHERRRLTVIFLAAAVLTCAFVGCSLLRDGGSPSSEGESETATDGAAPSPTDPSTEEESTSETLPALPSDPTVEDLRLYYETLLSQMNDTLLEERADRFMAEYNYQQRIKALEKALEEAKKENSPTTEESQTDESKPTGGTPQTPPDDNGSDSGNTNGNGNNNGGGLDGNGNSPSDGDHSGEGSDNGTVPPVTDPSADYTYTVSDGGVTILAYIGHGGAVSIPSEIEGRPVVAIADDAFKNKDVTAVAIPDTVVSIGWFAFYGCHALEQVTIPTSVTAIAYAAFDGCPSLTVYCTAGSYAAAYAAGFGIKYQIV